MEYTREWWGVHSRSLIVTLSGWRLDNSDVIVDMGVRNSVGHQEGHLGIWQMRLVAVRGH